MRENIVPNVTTTQLLNNFGELPNFGEGYLETIKHHTNTFHMQPLKLRPVPYGVKNNEA